MVRRVALARNEFLVAVAVVAILLGLLGRTIYKVHESVARTQAGAAQVRPAVPGQPPRESPPPAEIDPPQSPQVVPASWAAGQGSAVGERRSR